VAPNLLAKTLVEELDVHCTHGCTFKDNAWVLDDKGCPETIKFGLRKAHHHVRIPSQQILNMLMPLN
jgi:hypothetical protein